jgi:hypothetical protein
MDMPDTDPLGDFAKRKVAESDARMKKVNPKGRKLDKNGNPIVTKEELEKSGMSLRDFLNKERGLTKRVTTSDRIKNDETRKRNTAPVTRAETDARVMADEKRKRDSAPISQAMDKSVGMKDDARRDNRGDFPGEGPAKSMAAEGGAGAAAAQEARAAKEKDASKYTTGMMGGGKVKGYKVGGSPGMHRMPDGKMMKDSAHKKHGGKVKGYKSGGKVRGAGIAKRGLGSGRMC